MGSTISEAALCSAFGTGCSRSAAACLRANPKCKAACTAYTAALNFLCKLIPPPPTSCGACPGSNQRTLASCLPVLSLKAGNMAVPEAVQVRDAA